MPLPAPNLDDRRFQQFVDDAKRYIQQRCPEWSDHNVSDPGVTLIEAVAYMADQVVYRLNRVPDKNYLAFLDLLGITLFPPAASRVDVTFWMSAPQPEALVVPVGTEVSTERTDTEVAISFATENDLVIPPCELQLVLRQVTGGAPEDRTQEVLSERDVSAFSAEPRAGDMVLFGLSVAVPNCAVVLELDSRVDGVGVDPRQPPLRWEALTSRGWQPCEVAEDSTGGLNRTGQVILHVPDGHTRSRLGQQEAGWLRCQVTEPKVGQPFYSVSPTLRSATAFTIGGTARAVHADDIHNEILGEAEGVPGQRMQLSRPPVVLGEPSLLLEVSDDDGWRPWEVVDNFAASDARSPHVRLDATTGEITFGPAVREPDGSVRQYGAVPLKGSVVRATRYRSGGGRTGNVSRGTVRVLRSSIPSIARVENREGARGGLDGETIDEAKVRAPITLRAQDRAVTPRDYEELTQRAAPEVARIACPTVRESGNENAVRVLVVPQAVPDIGGRLRFEQLVPGDELLARITRYLEDRRPLGVRLSVGPPFYQGVSVQATMHSFRGVSSQQVRAGALDALYEYLDPLTGGPQGDGWPFGRPLAAGELFAALQRVPGVELVDEVQLFPADPLTGRRADQTDRIDLAPVALLFPFDLRVRVIGDR
ncbi:putative baseplate assembly protein [Pseudonocardia xinjiangensis]|uniref:putative baseplate assembly protein n=1 Tax=Pseudonocardia xinjiangensis TaxID=75289 RepID=UPI003D9432A0